MHSPKTISNLLLHFLLPLCAVGINTKNNACKGLETYRIFPISPTCHYNPDVLSDVLQMAARHGYEAEADTVSTSDGYILTIFKISSSKVQGPKKAMFVHHGIATNSGPWVDIGNRSIAFYFADRGYDVYLGNARGSTYSNRHETLTVHNPKFWEFNLDALASIDLPTQLKHVVEKSGQKVVYVGHSMGTSIIFMYASEFADEASKYIERIITFAPVVYLDGAPGIVLAKPLAKPLLRVLDTIKIKGLFYHEKMIHKALTTYCKVISPEICRLVLNVAFGKTTQFASEDLLLYFSYWPSGTSIYMLKQFLQIADSKKFQKYDYGLLGSDTNLKKYGSLKPPTYDLKKLTLPIHLFYGENDSLFRKKNIERLYNELGSKEKTAMAVGSDVGKPFDHIDFLYSEYIVETLYDKIEEVLGISGGGGAVSESSKGGEENSESSKGGEEGSGSSKGGKEDSDSSKVGEEDTEGSKEGEENGKNSKGGEKDSEGSKEEEEGSGSSKGGKEDSDSSKGGEEDTEGSKGGEENGKNSKGDEEDSEGSKRGEEDNGSSKEGKEDSESSKGGKEDSDSSKGGEEDGKNSREGEENSESSKGDEEGVPLPPPLPGNEIANQNDSNGDNN